MRYAWIEEHRDAFGIARMCGLLEVSRSGYCQWRGQAPAIERGWVTSRMSRRPRAGCTWLR